MPSHSSRARAQVAPLACAIALLSFAFPARATTLSPMDVPALSTRADAVVLARCVSVSSAVDGATHRLATTSVFEVEERVRGAALDGEVRVTLPGGHSGTAGAVIAGVPSFRPGTSAVLFLTAPRADGSRGLLGLAQGAFEVLSDGSGASVRSTDGAFRSPPGAVRGPGGTLVPLGDFLAAVRSFR